MSTPEERAWEVVRRAYEERPPRPPRHRARHVAAVLAVAVVAAVVGAALSPPGRAVFERVREAVGVEHAEPALFSLPGGGRLLVVSSGHGGVWLVQGDGLKRRIGSYDDAQWSPHGLFLVATRRDELVALDAEGDVRWTLARRDPHAPRWEGTRTDTRIAYDTASGLRVVAGDGTGDHLLDRLGGRVPPAWDPARLHTLAYVAAGSIVLRHADGGLVWRRHVRVRPTALDWSSDGRYLAVVSTTRVVVLDRAGRLVRTISKLGSELSAATFAPGSHRLAIVARLGRRSEVHVLDLDRPGTGRLVLAGPGTFGDVAWGPGSDWLLVTWPAADQWVFLHGARAHAVGNIREQFPRADGVAPTLAVAGRWCCPS
jgi:hypothetical protein